MLFLLNALFVTREAALNLCVFVLHELNRMEFLSCIHSGHVQPCQGLRMKRYCRMDFGFPRSERLL